MDDPTVLEVAPSSRALLSTVSPGKGSNTPAGNIQHGYWVVELGEFGRG